MPKTIFVNGSKLMEPLIMLHLENSAAADGTVVANYEYGPFGELIRLSGPMAKLNPFRFSTKYDDDESALLYYGYRYYNPSTGRWLSRDPMHFWNLDKPSTQFRIRPHQHIMTSKSGMAWD